MREIKVKAKEEHRIKKGHYWLFSNELEKVDTIPEMDVTGSVSIDEMTDADKKLLESFYSMISPSKKYDVVEDNHTYAYAYDYDSDSLDF